MQGINNGKKDIVSVKHKHKPKDLLFKNAETNEKTGSQQNETKTK